ncbi:MAG: hypothetical protein MN733_10190, partial [Nitrososphaera sp.]|nr:hypothetical protein [Nitrososphaera sp.]
DEQGQFQMRRVPPWLIGIIKGHPSITNSILEIDSSGNYSETNLVTQTSAGVAAVEPGGSLRRLLEGITAVYMNSGVKINLQPPFQAN